MQKSYALLKQDLKKRLQEFYSKNIGSHGLVDEISLTDYKILRSKLSILLDKLAYPIAKLNYNHEETEWHDFWDIVSITTGL